MLFLHLPLYSSSLGQGTFREAWVVPFWRCCDTSTTGKPRVAVASKGKACSSSSFSLDPSVQPPALVPPLCWQWHLLKPLMKLVQEKASLFFHFPHANSVSWTGGCRGLTRAESGKQQHPQLGAGKAWEAQLVARRAAFGGCKLFFGWPSFPQSTSYRFGAWVLPYAFPPLALIPRQQVSLDTPVCVTPHEAVSHCIKHDWSQRVRLCAV